MDNAHTEPFPTEPDLLEHCKTIFAYADLPRHSYGDYQALVSQVANIYLQLLRDYLAHVPDDAVGDRTIAIGKLMLEIQELLLAQPS